MYIKEVDKSDIKILWIDKWVDFPHSGLLKCKDQDYYYEIVNHAEFNDTLGNVAYNPETDEIEDVEMSDLVVWYYIFEISEEELNLLYKKRAYFELSKSSPEALGRYYIMNPNKELNLKSNNILGFFRLSLSDFEGLRNEFGKQRFSQTSSLF